jgi:multidrug efflux pump subunit AcrB
LQSKNERKLQSHDVAKQVRVRLQPIAERNGARIKVAEVPPGPPVLQTLVAEVYGPDLNRRIELAAKIRNMFKKTAGVVDVDWYVEDDQTKLEITADTKEGCPPRY